MSVIFVAAILATQAAPYPNPNIQLRDLCVHIQGAAAPNLGIGSILQKEDGEVSTAWIEFLDGGKLTITRRFGDCAPSQRFRFSGDGTKAARLCLAGVSEADPTVLVDVWAEGVSADRARRTSLQLWTIARCEISRDGPLLQSGDRLLVGPLSALDTTTAP